MSAQTPAIPDLEDAPEPDFKQIQVGKKIDKKPKVKGFIEEFYWYNGLKGMLVFRYDQAKDPVVKKYNAQFKPGDEKRCYGICMAMSMSWLRQNIHQQKSLEETTFELEDPKGKYTFTYPSISAAQWQIDFQKQYEQLQDKDSKLIAAGGGPLYGQDASSKVLAAHGLRPALVASNMKFDVKTRLFLNKSPDVAKDINAALLKGLDPSSYGIIVLGCTTKPAGHQMACQFKVDAGGCKFRLFDPNFGEFVVLWKEDDDKNFLETVKKFLAQLMAIYDKLKYPWDLYSVYSIAEK